MLYLTYVLTPLIVFATAAYLTLTLRMRVQVGSLHYLKKISLLILYTALVFYEYVLTSRDEARLVWQRKWTASTLLFLVNRYSMIINTVNVVVPYTSKVCVHIHGWLIFPEEHLRSCQS